MKKILNCPEWHVVSVDVTSFEEDKKKTLEAAASSFKSLANNKEHQKKVTDILKTQTTQINEEISNKAKDGVFKFCIPLELSPGKVCENQVLSHLQKIYGDIGRIQEDVKTEAISLEITIPVETLTAAKVIGFKPQ